MRDAERFPFTAADVTSGEASFTPLLPITLTHAGNSLSVSGLLDTGATVNVLPYRLSLDLGATWEPEAATIHLTGNLARYEACPLVATAAVGTFNAVRLAFAWTQADDIPLILGQVNFFMEFDVCFYRSQRIFELRPKK